MSSPANTPDTTAERFAALEPAMAAVLVGLQGVSEWLRRDLHPHGVRL